MLEKVPQEASPEDGIKSGLEWLRRQGHRVICTPSGCWYNAAPGVLQAFPYHPVIDPPEEELSQLLRGSRALALRYSAPVASRVGKVSYHVVYSKPAYGLENVSRQTRQNIRKGLAYAVIEPVSFARLAEEGWPLRAETLARQGRPKAESPGWWRTLCLSAIGLRGFEAWGAFHDGKLVGAVVAYFTRSCYLLLYQQSLTDHLRHGVNNTLGYAVTEKVLARPGVKQLSYGLESLDASWTVDEFKFRMGYEAFPVRQRIVFHPCLRPFVRRWTLEAAKAVGDRMFRGSRWLKAAGMMRFYLEGNLPLSRQSFPECLSGLIRPSPAGPRPGLTEHGEGLP